MLTRHFWFLLFISVCRSEEHPTVATPSGKISGTWKVSTNGKKFLAFEGIPYAKPPVGKRRFEPPEPMEALMGTWEANFLSTCAQTNAIHPELVVGEEDCLYLNVYTPLAKPDPSSKLEVIVHIHGGAFMSGSGHSYSRPEYFIDRNVIFVSFNYRIGVFGFLSTGDDVVSGNNGLKDQVLALKWVRANIAHFGGDPDSVTITGISTGASSVHLHYLSDMSKNLFQKGFSQSGTALNPFALQDEPLTKTKILAGAVGCADTSTNSIIKCLKERPYKHILSKLSVLYGYTFTPFAPLGPVLEKGREPFLTKNPYYLMATGLIQDRPWLVSNTAHEGLFPGAYLYNELDNIEKNWAALAPFLLDYNYTLANILFENTAEKIKEFYLGENGKIDESNFLKLIEILGDRLFLVDTDTAVKLQTKFNKESVYYYYFSYPGDHSTAQTVSHGEDSQYFFHKIFSRELSPNESKMRDFLMEMLVSFARTGKPEIEGVSWEPTKFSEITFLNVTSFKKQEVKLMTVKELAPKSFWHSLGFLENQNLVLMKDPLEQKDEL